MKASTKKKPIGQKGKQGKSKDIPQADPFIDPFIYQLQRKVKTKEATIGSHPFITLEESLERIPRELQPFIIRPTIQTLATLLKKHYWLYWHPIVRTQMLYLKRLNEDEKEWDRLGWGVIPREDTGSETWTSSTVSPPEEIHQVGFFIRLLTQAHIQCLFPIMTIQPIHVKGKTGPKDAVRNPYPNDGSAEIIPINVLYEDWLTIKGQLANNNELARILKKLPRHPSHTKISQIHTLIVHSLDNNGPKWSHLCKPVHQEGRCWPIYRWAFPGLDQWVVKMCQGETKSAGKEGKPAYLAYSILACLLNHTPQTIRGKIGNFKRANPTDVQVLLERSKLITISS